MSTLVVIVLIVIAILFLHWYNKNFKRLSCNAVSMFTGAPKTGKSTLAIYTCTKDYFSYKRHVKIINLFRKLLHRDLLEMPCLYSNIPLNIKGGYVPLTKKLLLGEERFVENSFVYIGEVSLVADSMSFRNMNDITSEEIMLFNKLAGHRSIRVYYDTQCINDCHYSIKRCLSEYYYIYKLKRVPLLPFAIAYVREERYSDDDSTLNIYSEDTEDTLKKVLINTKKIWSIFDYKCYSNLGGYQLKPLNNKVIELDNTSSLKADNVVSFKEFKSIKNEVK